MVKLAEWRGKELFRRYGVPVPRGQLVHSADETLQVLQSGAIPMPCVIKVQAVAGGRGKAGGVKFASTSEEAGTVARSLLAQTFQGETIRELLVEERVTFERELYLSLTLDRSARMPLLIASSHGGVDIESVPEASIAHRHVHPFAGLTSYEVRGVTETLGLSGELARSLGPLLQAIWKCFQDEDAELVEINPLAVVGERLVALDSKVIIEDDATFRHPQYAAIRDDRTPLEELAREKEIAFVQLDGNIGVIANGAGLTMATLDALSSFGGAPGVFLDLGGTDDPAKVTEAFLLMARAKPAAVFLNIFGGVTRCDTVALGLVDAMRTVPPGERFPLVARIRGNNEAEGVRILQSAGVTSLPDLEGSARAVVEAARGRGIAAAGGKAG